MVWMGPKPICRPRPPRLYRNSHDFVPPSAICSQRPPPSPYRPCLLSLATLMAFSLLSSNPTPSSELLRPHRYPHHTSRLCWTSLDAVGQERPYFIDFS